MEEWRCSGVGLLWQAWQGNSMVSVKSTSSMFSRTDNQIIDLRCVAPSTFVGLAVAKLLACTWPYKQFCKLENPLLENRGCSCSAHAIQGSLVATVSLQMIRFPFGMADAATCRKHSTHEPSALTVGITLVGCSPSSAGLSSVGQDWFAEFIGLHLRP